MRLPLSLLPIGLVATACSRPVPPDFELRLQRTACFGPCPVYSVTIDAKGQVTYEGTEFVQVVGTASDTLSAHELARLAAAARRARLFARPVNYTNCPEQWTDNPSLIISLRSDGHSCRVRHDLGCRGLRETRAFDELGTLIDRVTASERWTGARP